MSSSSSPATKSIAIGAIVLAAAGTGVVLLNKPSAPPPASSSPAAASPQALPASVSAPAPSTTASTAAASAAASQPAALPASSPAASVQLAPLDVTTLTQTAPGKKASGTRRFPFVSSPNAPVAARINNQLFIDTFEVMAPARASDGLREVSADTWRSRPEIDFKVQRNDGRLFSVTFANEGCGAYCESYNTAYAFDAASGRRLDIEDLFTPAGRAELGKELKASTLAAIKAEISRLKSGKSDKAKASAGKEVAAEDRAAAIKMYEDCAQQRQSPDYGSALETRAMDIQAKAVVFTAERCSNHAMRALDNLGNFTLRLAPEKLAPQLSAYGRYLLLGEKAQFSEPTSPWGQVFHGSMGDKLPVTVYVGSLNPDGSVMGVYFYDRHRKPISLSGRFAANTLTLNEAGSKDKQPPRMVLSPQGKGLRGRWEGASSLDLTLEP